MSNEFEKKTTDLIDLADGALGDDGETAIPMPGETKAEEAVAQVEETKAEEAVAEVKAEENIAETKADPVKNLPVDQPQPKKKKGGVLGKVLLSIVGVILVLALALAGTVCGIISCAVADEMPEAPDVSNVDTKEFIIGAVTEILKENTISLTPEFINSILVTVKEQVNASTDLIRIDDLFCDLENSAGTIYARVYIGEVEVKGITLNIDKVVPVQADFNVDFDTETKDIIADIGQISCGKIDIPEVVINTVLGQVALPEDVTIDADGNIRYNTAKLDAMIDEAVSEAITSSIAGSLGSWLSELATGLINVDLQDAEIVEDKLVITGEVFK